jgi:thiamine-phosphate pyrophosphorylase
LRNFPHTDLYCLTAEAYSLGRTNAEVVGEMIAAGIQVIQYREKDKSMREKFRECQKIRRMTMAAGVIFIVNDDVDLAMMMDADGIHVGQEDLPVPEIRRLVGEKMIIGLSTHSPEQAREAERIGADYIGVGPIFRTTTKKDVCDPVGFQYLEYVVENIKIPFVAIGGIKESHVREISGRGARCIAMVTEIVGAGNIRQKIADIRSRIRK